MTTENKENFVPTTNPSDVSVQEMFGSILQQRISDGALEKAITEKVDRMIDDVVSDAFRSYGDIAKSMKEAITASITPNLNDIGRFPAYHHFVMQSLNAAVTRFQDEKLQAVIDKEMEELFKELPEQLTLSWVLEQIKEQVKGDDDEDRDGHDLTLIIDGERSFKRIYISKEEGRDKYRCEYRIDIHHGEIYSVKVDDKEVSKSLCVGPLYHFEKAIFNAYVMRAELILDKGSCSGDYDTYVESNYDY